MAYAKTDRRTGFTLFKLPFGKLGPTPFDKLRAGRRGFTLIELLVVVSIIALLISILLPALGEARNAALLVTERAHMKGVGLALQMYAGDNSARLPGGNDGRHRDHWTVRGRLYNNDYLRADPELPRQPTSKVWGCPVTDRYDWGGGARYAGSWWWNAGWGGSLDADGDGLSNRVIDEDLHPHNGDRIEIFIDGRGFLRGGKDYLLPFRIGIITDNGGLPGVWTHGFVPWPNHPPQDDITGKPLGSNTLFLDGHADWRTQDELNRTWNGGVHTWR